MHAGEVVLQPSPVMSPAQVDALLAADPAARVLDVRTPGEYETAHIGGAYNVPLDILGEHGREIRSVRAPVVLVCQSGSRARRADAVLRAAGMANLRILDGGMTGWFAAGRPVVRASTRVSLERQVRIVAGSLAALGGTLALVLSPWFALLPVVVGGGLAFAGITDTCGMALVLARMPYNRSAACDVAAITRALADTTP